MVRKWNTICDIGILWHELENEAKNNNRTLRIMVTLAKFRKFQIATSNFFSLQSVLHREKLWIVVKNEL